ncbi:MAG: glycosyltransferase family 2 protein [Bacteroides sp.]|nr:glycosyltransferase family 2 protein [Prevotella sp.]MCM1407863.1 glycosyltransferase family 2 protein [Treponema brennaborense]MCM1469605.1 glycosyltransferase family 2 protein [Bacteroides sp.]
MKVSICIPVYNGADSIERLLAAIDEAFRGTEKEVVLVNDGSSDSSAQVCRALTERYDYVRFVDLRKNSGEHNAVMCALNYCTGDCAAIIDDDLQNPPEEIFKLIDEMKKGYDVVFAKYHKKRHSFLRNLGSKFNDLFATWLLEKPKDLYLCSFKLITRPVIDEIIKYKGPFPYVDGLILRVTDNFSSVYVKHNARETGHSNYNLKRLVRLYLNMFINFSIKPMRLIMGIGFAIMIIALILAAIFIIEKLLQPEISAGWTSLAVLVLFFGGLQSFFLGLIGEYIGKNYLDKNGTPQWTVKNVYGLEKNEARKNTE